MKAKGILRSFLAGAIAAVGMTAAVTANAEPTLVVNGVTQSGGVATVSYTASGLDGYNTANAKFVFEITANGTTKAFTNANAVVAGSGTASVNFKSAFGNANTLPLASYHARIAGIWPTVGPHGAPIPEAVQLWEGGPEWATWNVGATKPEEAGWYFWWGDTKGYKRNSANNGWIGVDGTDADFQFTTSNGKIATYNKTAPQLQSAGYTDSTGNLVAAHDAATAHLGNGWRMPTDADIQALINNTTTTWTTRNGVSGRLVKGRGNFSTAEIFIPAAGYGYGSSLNFPGSNAYCWSSTPDSDSNFAWTMNFYSSNFGRSYYNRYYGVSVRAVRDLP